VLTGTVKGEVIAGGLATKAHLMYLLQGARLMRNKMTIVLRGSDNRLLPICDYFFRRKMFFKSRLSAHCEKGDKSDCRLFINELDPGRRAVTVNDPSSRGNSPR
jgi:hypothetical protein